MSDILSKLPEFHKRWFTILSSRYQQHLAATKRYSILGVHLAKESNKYIKEWDRSWTSLEKGKKK